MSQPAAAAPAALPEPIVYPEPDPNHLARVDALRPTNQRKIAIVAKAPSTRALAPFDDPSWEIWSLGDNYTMCPRWDQWFELHDIDRYRNQRAYWGWLTTDHGDRPIWTEPQVADMPNSHRFPSAELLDMFAFLRGDRYHTCSISWMLALALAQRPAMIGLFGVEMECDELFDSEYAMQRPACEYWLGVLEGLGVQLVLPANCMLLKTAQLYGIAANRGYADRKLRTKLTEIEGSVAYLDWMQDEANRAHLVSVGQVMSLRDVMEMLGDAKIQSLEVARNLVAQRCSQLAKEAEQSGIQSRQLYRNHWKLVGGKENLKWLKQLL